VRALLDVAGPVLHGLGEVGGADGLAKVLAAELRVLHPAELLTLVRSLTQNDLGPGE
jgi:hypothetical protein